MEDRFVTAKKSKEAENFQSEFENGLPSDYVPQDFSRVNTEQKLKADLKFRRERLENQFIHELVAAGDNQELKSKLYIKHQKAREEFRAKQVELRKKMIEEEMLYRNRGLR